MCLPKEEKPSQTSLSCRFKAAVLPSVSLLIYCAENNRTTTEKFWYFVFRTLQSLDSHFLETTLLVGSNTKQKCLNCCPSKTQTQHYEVPSFGARWLLHSGARAVKGTNSLPSPLWSIVLGQSTDSEGCPASRGVCRAPPGRSVLCSLLVPPGQKCSPRLLQAEADTMQVVSWATCRGKRPQKAQCWFWYVF